MKQRTETKMNKLQELFVHRVETMHKLRDIEAEINELLGVVADINMMPPHFDEKPKVKKAKNTGNGGGTRKKSTCSICGEVGHNVKTCPKESPERYGFHKETTAPGSVTPVVSRPGDEIEITQNMKERINFLVREGGGIRAVMEEYELERPVAVRLIARVKNVAVSNLDEEVDPE